MAFTLSLFWGFSEKELLPQAREQSQQQRPNTALAPHNYANFGQGARRDARSGNYSSTLNSKSVFGATNLIRGGMSESLVMSELERSYKMIDALNEQKRALYMERQEDWTVMMQTRLQTPLQNSLQMV